MTLEAAKSFSFAIEISGWDASETFFVEHTRLQWSAEAGEKLVVHHPLHSAAVVFLRLMNPAGGDGAFPVAYRVEAVRKLDDREPRAWELRVAQMHACLHSQYETVRAAENEIFEGQCT